jgi:streptomycin 3"-adenylyltransferase
MSQRGQTPDSPYVAARAVGRALSNALGEDLVAVYLHGSAVLGGFRWHQSDLDILALSRGELSDQQLRRVAHALASSPYPANGLELSLMTASEAVAPELPAPRFQVHVTTAGATSADKVVDGRTRAGDTDLVLHLAVCRARGLAVVGPPPLVTLAAIPAETVLSVMRDEIAWARTHASAEYLVLTSARVWLFAETGRITSKIEAGEWAAERYVEPSVIDAALARQRGASAEIAMGAAERLAEHVERLTLPT